MSRYIRPFRCEVLTPAGCVCAHEAISAILPAGDGQYGVLGGRGPLVTMLGGGPLTIETSGGERLEYFAAGGFANMRQNVLTVVADECALLSDLDREDAWQAIERAREMPVDTDESYERRTEALGVARARFALVQARGQRRE